MKANKVNKENCSLCGCKLYRKKGIYATSGVEGRSSASKHHYVAERFFGRSQTRKGTKYEAIFEKCPWDSEGKSAMFCYECHELLIHNPVLLQDDIRKFAALINKMGLNEDDKSESKEKLAGRIRLFHEAIAKGLDTLMLNLDD